MKLVLESDNKKVRVIVTDTMQKYDLEQALHNMVLIGELKDAVKKFRKQKKRG